jgi:hypothetical protein
MSKVTIPTLFRTLLLFELGKDLSSWNISKPDYYKLNKVYKTSPEAFSYYLYILELLHLTKRRNPLLYVVNPEKSLILRK